MTTVQGRQGSLPVISALCKTHMWKVLLIPVDSSGCPPPALPVLWLCPCPLQKAKTHRLPLYKAVVKQLKQYKFQFGTGWMNLKNRVQCSKCSLQIRFRPFIGIFKHIVACGRLWRQVGWVATTQVDPRACVPGCRQSTQAISAWKMQV